ncbi:MAG: hypothetical protein ABI947_09935 [Chloroflexota bacterium]
MRFLHRFSGFVCVVLLFVLSAFGTHSNIQAAATKTPPPSASAAVGTLAVAIYDNSGRTNILYLIDTNGKNSKQLDVPITQYAYKRLIAWSPDGAHLAFVDKNYQISVSNPDGSSPQSIASSRPIFAWTADSQQITFESAQGQGGQIVSADVATGMQHPVITLKENKGEHIDTLAWSSDGKWLSYIISGGSGTKLHVVEIASGDDQALNTAVTPNGAVWNPVMSQAGKLAYFGAGSGKGGIFIYDLASKMTTPLFNSYVFVGHADWSPDGTQLVYDATGGLAIIDAKSHKSHMLTLPDALLKKEFEGLAWQPTPSASTASAAGTMAPTAASK